MTSVLDLANPRSIGHQYVVQRDRDGHVRAWRVGRNATAEFVIVKEVDHVSLHSPTGFEWGYLGSGPADLALSLLADHFECKICEVRPGQEA